VFATKGVLAHQDYADFDDADVCSVVAVTTGGVQVVITGTRHGALGQDVRLEAFGSNDSVSAGLNPRTPLRTAEGDLTLNTDPYRGFVDRFREAFRNETQSFVSFAAGEIANPCPPDSAVESLRIAIACEQSVATGSAVRVADVT
jgi:myo-inositol 2-dehydrogenase/D-chiro-inositol 1-dehydrogenase